MSGLIDSGEGLRLGSGLQFIDGLGGAGLNVETAFNPTDLFAGTGLVGGYYNPSIMASLFQERSSPSTYAVVDGVVGTMLDLSGNGFHMIAQSDAGRCVLRQSGTTFYLEVDGVNDWYKPASLLDLQAHWYHCGSWLNSSTGTRSFATTNEFRGAIRNIGNAWSWWSSGGAAAAITGTGVGAAHTLTVEMQAAYSNLSARLNGAAGTPLTPFDTSAQTEGLALFTDSNASFSSGMAGRFYGAVWARGALSTTNRTNLETYMTGLWS